MNCQQRRELIVARVAGLLRGEPARELRDHIRECSDCTDRFYYYEKLWKDLEAWPDPEAHTEVSIPSAPFAPPPTPCKRTAGISIRWFHFAAAAAAMILLCASAVIAFRALSTDGRAGAQVARQSRKTPTARTGMLTLATVKGTETRPVNFDDRITLPGGARAWVQLADGHGFHLSREASLELLPTATGNSSIRRVRIHTGVVDVCKQASESGLELVVPGGKLTVQGTFFRVTVSSAREGCTAGKSHTEVALYEGRVAAEGAVQGPIALEPGELAIITEFRERGRIEGHLMSIEQTKDLIGRPLQALRIRSDHVGECLVLVPDSTAPVEASADDLADSVKELEPGDAIAVTFVLGEDGLWVQKLEKRRQAGAKAFLACEAAFGAPDAQARGRLTRRFGPGSNPKTWSMTAAEATEIIDSPASPAARRYATRLLADRLDEIEHGRDAMSALEAILAHADKTQVEATVFPALYRVFFIHRDPILWQRAAELLRRLKDPAAAASFRMAAVKFASIDAFPKTVTINSGFGSFDMEYDGDDRRLQQTTLLKTIAEAMAAIAD